MVIGSKRLKMPASEKMLSDFAEGDIVLLNENGSPVEFYVACHDYEETLNGAGRTLLVRKTVHSKRQFDPSNGQSSYIYCGLRTFLNGDYLSTFDAEVQAAMAKTKFVTTGTLTVEDAVSILNLGELTSEHGAGKACGTLLPIAETLALAYGEEFWLRYGYWMSVGSTYYIVTAPGTSTSWPYTESYKKPATSLAVVPCFTLPSTAKFDHDTLLFKGVA